MGNLLEQKRLLNNFILAKIPQLFKNSSKMRVLWNNWYWKAYPARQLKPLPTYNAFTTLFSKKYRLTHFVRMLFLNSRTSFNQLMKKNYLRLSNSI
jgi:hypothetical protein